MSGFMNIIQSVVHGGKPQDTAQMTNAEIAELLKTSPEALSAFSRAYSSFEDSDVVSDNVFQINARQAARAHQAAVGTYGAAIELISTISQDLLSQDTPHRVSPVGEHKDESIDNTLLLAEIMEMPEEMRPQLTGARIQKDIAAPAFPMILSILERAGRITDPRKKQQATLEGLAMLDTLDLDPVMYEMLSRNPAAMGSWFPQLERAVASTGFFKIPETTICKVPLPILQMSRLDYFSLTPTTLEIIDAWTREAFQLDENKEYFIKTGTYSSKFDFRNTHVHSGQEVREIGQYLTFIQFQANQMASPLNRPGPIAGVSTTNEWVVREWIQDESDSPTIYHGMPLRTEFRVFIDCDTDEVLAVAPYWDPEIMLERFEQRADSQDPDMRHDAIVFRAHQEKITARFEEFADVVAQQVETILPALDLTGQWSLDIMLNDTAGEQLYAIDMAPAASSALSHHVPAGRLKPQNTDWIPRLGA